MRKQSASIPFSVISSHDGVPLAFESRGQGSPLLLFIHGWTCRRNYWRPQLDCFCSRYSVAALDLPGHGDSGSDNRARWGMESFALDVVACVKALKAEKVILIGHSMGGGVALEAARHLSGTVAGVLLVDTFIIDYGGLSTEAVQTLAEPFSENFKVAMVNLIEQTSTTATPPELKQQLIREMAAADPALALSVWSNLLSWNPQAAFKELQVPIHAINGDLIPVSARERCLPFITETLIPGAGHFLQMEDPAGFNFVLEEVLARFS